MLVKRFYDDALAQASWLIGCQATGEAIVVDPNRDVQPYVDAAQRESVRITHVTETHIHADFVSGSRELAQRTGARLYLSAEGGRDWQYGFAAEAGATLLHGGDTIRVGNIRLDVRHTPGHTPEHLCFVVTDTAGADAPMGVVTGDFVFVGDVGRPDLLEKAAGVANTMRDGARTLFRSLEWFRTLPDYVQVWPGHGAGSACGKSLGAVPQSTVGYERLFNPAVAITDEAEFVEYVLAGQPEPPRYFAHMKRINRDGPKVLGGLPEPGRLAPGRLRAVLDQDGLVVDTRSAAEYARASVPQTISIPLNRSFPTWAGWLVPYDREFWLLAGDAAAASSAARELAMIGLDRIAGYFGPDAIDAWSIATGREPSTMDVVEIDDVKRRAHAGDAVAILDVRGENEWNEGHLPFELAPDGILHHVPLGYLEEHVAGLPRDRPLLVHCASGARSAIAVSLLEKHGFENAANIAGGFDAWRRAGYPVAKDEGLAAAASPRTP
jgi:hydroxyacylglutathione hydrolase